MRGGTVGGLITENRGKPRKPLEGTLVKEKNSREFRDSGFRRAGFGNGPRTPTESRMGLGAVGFRSSAGFGALGSRRPPYTGALFPHGLPGELSV